MRTPEQIKNLRRVAGLMFGTVANILQDDDIDEWANKIQNQIDNIKTTWEVKVRTKHNQFESWDNIEKEPTVPYFSIKEMQYKCEELLDKYQNIVSIKITNVYNPEEEFLFQRPNS